MLATSNLDLKWSRKYFRKVVTIVAVNHLLKAKKNSKVTTEGCCIDYLFGGQSTGQQQTPKPIFGGAVSSGASMSLFGGTQQNKPLFSALGSSTTTNGFGLFSSGLQSTGSTSNSVFGGAGSGGVGGIFGNTSTTTSLFGASQAQSAGTAIPYKPKEDKDSTTTNGVTTANNVKFTCITFMDCYKDKSLEELRLEDYQLQRHKKIVFGSSTFPISNSTLGVGTGLFGQSSNTSAVDGRINLFAQKPSPFSFGGNTFGASTTGTAATPTAQPLSGMFSQQQGSTITPFAIGSGPTNIFSANQQQQLAGQQGNNFLNNTTGADITAGVAPSLFSGSGNIAFGATNTAKPIFGGTIVPTGTPFGASATTGTQGSLAFGTNGTAPAGNLFGAASQQTPTQPWTVGSALTKPATSTPFGGTTAAVNSSPINAFGGSRVISLGSLGNAAPGFAVKNSTGLQQPKPSIFTVGAAGVTSNAGSVGLGTNLVPSTAFSFRPAFGVNSGVSSCLVPSQTTSAGYYQLSFMPPQIIAFGTSVFKDNPLFYNLPTNYPMPKSREKQGLASSTTTLFVPTTSRRMRVSPNAPPGLSGVIDISSSPSAKKLTALNRSMNSNLSNMMIFDGFEEEDWGIGINILAPKTQVKKLDLNRVEESLLSITNHDDFPVSLGSGSSSRMTHRCLEIESERHKRTETMKKSLSDKKISPLLLNRRVRFALPPLSSDYSEGESLTVSTILSPRSHILNDISCSASSFNFGLRNTSDWEVPNKGEAGRSVETMHEITPGTLCGVVSTRKGYYLKPPMEELDRKVDENGNCIVTRLEIGRTNFGHIKFLGALNIININIDNIVHFRHKEVVVYPDDRTVPPIGEGLNVPAVVQLERVWPVDKESKELIRNSDDGKCKEYETRLRRACERMGVEFLSYTMEEGIWKFRVNHF